MTALLAALLCAAAAQADTTNIPMPPGTLVDQWGYWHDDPNYVETRPVALLTVQSAPEYLTLSDTSGTVLRIYRDGHMSVGTDSTAANCKEVYRALQQWAQWMMEMQGTSTKDLLPAPPVRIPGPAVPLPYYRLPKNWGYGELYPEGEGFRVFPKCDTIPNVQVQP